MGLIKKYINWCNLVQNNAREKIAKNEIKPQEKNSNIPLNKLSYKSHYLKKIKKFWKSEITIQNQFINRFSHYCNDTPQTKKDCKDYCYEALYYLNKANKSSVITDEGYQMSHLVETINLYQSALINIKKINLFSNNYFSDDEQIFIKYWSNYIVNTTTFKCVIGSLILLLKEKGSIIQSEFIKISVNSPIVVTTGENPYLYRLLIKEACSIGIVSRAKKGNSYLLSIKDESLFNIK
ncbi:MAG: hypothetical protein ACPKOI_05660 [Pleomorphochaeta sp.]